MKRTGFLVIGMLAGTWLPTLGFACEPAPPVETRDDRLVTGPDCSFRNGGTDDKASAAGAIDIGGSIVGQKYSYLDACSQREELLVVDCTRVEAILINGLEVEPAVPSGYASSIAPLQKPKGPIGLTPKTTIAELARVSEANDFTYTLNVLGLAQKESRRNRYDPFCGCKLFYPDGAGAQN
ncbi:hypothetical protein [Tabrizicola sp.]|uniref:hypothetical protein n=1 Tax=Tabrizicola sp. TaxID=2005166 RepID=UPI003F39101C